jgi:hypothetical protein
MIFVTIAAAIKNSFPCLFVSATPFTLLVDIIGWFDDNIIRYLHIGFFNFTFVSEISFSKRCGY